MRSKPAGFSSFLTVKQSNQTTNSFKSLVAYENESAAQALKGMVKRSYDGDYGPDTQNLVWHLAAKYPRHKVERKKDLSWDEGTVLGHTLHLHVYRGRRNRCTVCRAGHTMSDIFERLKSIL